MSAATSSLAQAAQRLGADALVAEVLRRAAVFVGQRERAEAEDRARRADDAIESGLRDLLEVGRPSSRLRCLTSRRSSRADSGSVLTKRSVSRMTPVLKLLPSVRWVAVPSVISTLPPPMSMTAAVLPPTSTP